MSDGCTPTQSAVGSSIGTGANEREGEESESDPTDEGVDNFAGECKRGGVCGGSRVPTVIPCGVWATFSWLKKCERDQIDMMADDLF